MPKRIFAPKTYTHRQLFVQVVQYTPSLPERFIYWVEETGWKLFIEDWFGADWLKQRKTLSFKKGDRKLYIRPGDYVVRYPNDVVLVMDEEDFKKMYKSEKSKSIS